MASTDPATPPSRTSWYLATNLPAPGSRRADRVDLEVAHLAEVVRLYALRNWIEQSYKQVKNALGWAHFQVRKDVSIRRHWQMVCCAFAFCWWESSDFVEAEPSPRVTLQAKEPDPASETSTPPEGGQGATPDPSLRTSRGRWRAQEGEGMAGTIRHAHALPEAFSGKGPYLYAREHRPVAP